MSTFEAIMNAVRRFLPQTMAVFRAWFAAVDAEAWDRQFEQDVKAGRLDALADEAVKDLRETLTTEL